MSSSYMIPKVELAHNEEEHAAPKDEEKMPLFLIKLWNIVEDPAYQEIIRWDESGCSFHIVDPYSFCRNVLPHYFKHNNLNSFIRQLNMYGFRKMTPLDKGGLTRAESDQDHLEFSHFYFARDRPDLLVNIKRKASGRQETGGGTGHLTAVMDEIRQLREKQRNMDAKMLGLIKENESMWEQISHMRQQHIKQQQVVTKLVQFLVALVQPGQKRIPKRGMLALDEAPPTKRTRVASQNNLSDVLDRLQQELIDRGPIIADVTEDFSPQAPTPAPDQTASSSRVDALSPTISLSPSIDRQLSAELTDYLAGMDAGIDNCRDLIGNHYDLDFGDFGDLDDEHQDGSGQLALGAPLDGPLEEIFPATPELLTPSTSPNPR